MQNPTVTLNPDQKLYVIKCGAGFTCFGYDNCFREVNALSQILRGTAQDEISLKGTLECYELRTRLLGEYSNHPASRRTWFTPGTNPKVQSILERYRNSGANIRLFLGDTESGRDWLEENEVMGQVGRSTGTLKVPLLINHGEHWGGAISTDRIIRMMDVVTNTDIYRHPKFHQATLRMGAEDTPGYPWAVYADEQLTARFRTLYEGAEFIEFLSGRKAATDAQMRELMGDLQMAA